jgi:hypothetical protein
VSESDVLVIARKRLQGVLDEAVRRGRMTRDDAADLLAEITRRAISAPTDETVRRDEFPIAGYDDLAAAEVTGRLDGLDAAELRRVREYERRNANRKTVLAALDARLES